MYVMGLSVVDGSGGPRIAIQYSNALARRGAKVVILTDCDPGAVQKHLGFSGLPLWLIGCYPRLAILDFIRLLWKAKRRDDLVFIAPFQSDLIYLFLVAKVLNLPLVYLLQNQGDFSGRLWVRKLKFLILNYVIWDCDKIIAVSPNLVRYAREVFHLGSSRLRLVRNGVDIPIVDNRILSGQGEFWKIVNVGRICVQKNQLLLLSVISRLPDFYKSKIRVYIYGDCRADVDVEYKASLIEFMERNKLADFVTMAGWVSDVSAELANADLMIHTAKWEGSPLAVLEAYAIGVPVISTPCFELPNDFVDSKHGWFVKTFQAEEMLERLIDVIDHGKQNSNLVGRAARDYVSNRLSASSANDKFCSEMELLSLELSGTVL